MAWVQRESNALRLFFRGNAPGLSPVTNSRHLTAAGRNNWPPQDVGEFLGIFFLHVRVSVGVCVCLFLFFPPLKPTTCVKYTKVISSFWVSVQGREPKMH